LAKKSVLLVLLLVIAAACSEKEAPAVMRESIDTYYVAVPELQIRKSPDAGAEVIETFYDGSPLTVLAKQPEWVEVRIDSETSGWVLLSEVSTTEPVADAADSGPGGARFKKRPSPVYSNTPVTGEIVLEAQVNEYGRVMSVRTISNTTGSVPLEAKNAQELRNAEFFPLRQSGRIVPFVYEYRVTY
jgi:uncharacterized protein YgiM (DUF1202 family)